MKLPYRDDRAHENRLVAQTITGTVDYPLCPAHDLAYVASRAEDLMNDSFCPPDGISRLVRLIKACEELQKGRVDTYPKLEVALPQPNMIAMVPAHQFDAAKKRIEELEETVKAARSRCEFLSGLCKGDEERAKAAAERANRLSDEAGALRTELTQVKAELYDALRKVERLERKGGKR